MNKQLAILGLILFILFTGCSNKQEEGTKLTISAAISLTDALKEIKEIYEEEHDISLSFNLAGSGTLAQQIEQGAPVDLFISANSNWMDHLEEKELILSNSRQNIAENELVIISHINNHTENLPLTAEAFHPFEQIAIGNPDSVPAGNYTREALKAANLWDDLEEKAILTKDVRQVLTYVETENADLGFVYKSDALLSEKVKILRAIDAGLHEPIVYPAAVTKESKSAEEAKEFIQYLLQEEARHIFKKYGFH